MIVTSAFYRLIQNKGYEFKNEWLRVFKHSVQEVCECLLMIKLLCVNHS